MTGEPIISRETIIGLKKAGTWGTAVACGAGDGILMKSDGISQSIEENADDSAGIPFIEQSDQGSFDAKSSPNGYMRYEGLDVALALIMGAAGTPAVANTSQGAIEGASKAAACEITWTAHGMETLDKCILSGITQAQWTALNGLQTITKVDINKFTVAVNTSAFTDAYVPGTDPGIAVKASALVYSNTLTLGTTNDGSFATLAAKRKSDQIWELPGLKLFGFKLTGSMNKPVEISLEGIADRLVLDSAINTTVTIANVTYPDKAHRIIMNSAAKFRINDQSGAALADSDKVYPSDFEFGFSRNMSADLVAGNTYVAEPLDEGFPTISLTLNFPRYNDANAAFFTAWNAHTAKKIDIWFIGSVIDGTDTYLFKLQIPKAVVRNPESAMGAGKYPAKVTFDLQAVTTAPTGMTGILKPFQIVTQNTRSTSPLT